MQGQEEGREKDDLQGDSEKEMREFKNKGSKRFKWIKWFMTNDD